MCFIIRYNDVCQDCQDVIHSEDKPKWCSEKTWVRQGPFRPPMPYCPKGVTLEPVNKYLNRCHACWVKSHVITRGLNMPCNQPPGRQQSQSHKQQGEQNTRDGNLPGSPSSCQSDQAALDRETPEPSEEAQGFLARGAGLLKNILGGYAPSFFRGGSSRRRSPAWPELDEWEDICDDDKTA